MGNSPVLCFITRGYSLFPNLIIYRIYIYIYICLLYRLRWFFEKCQIEIYSSLILTQIELRARWGSFGMACYFSRCPRQRWGRFAALSLYSMSRGAVGLIELVLSKALKLKRKEAHIRGIVLEGDGSRSGRWLRNVEGVHSFFNNHADVFRVS